MQLPDIWQAIGSHQIAEITAVVSTAISIVLALQGQLQMAIKKKHESNKFGTSLACFALSWLGASVWN